MEVPRITRCYVWLIGVKRPRRFSWFGWRNLEIDIDNYILKLCPDVKWVIYIFIIYLIKIISIYPPLRESVNMHINSQDRRSVNKKWYWPLKSDIDRSGCVTSSRTHHSSIAKTFCFDCSLRWLIGDVPRQNFVMSRCRWYCRWH